jgi:hypothetical protein
LTAYSFLYTIDSMTALPVFRLAFPFHNPTTNRLLNSIAESLVQKPSLESEKNEHMVYAGNDKWASTKWLQEQREKKEAKRKGAYPSISSSKPFLEPFSSYCLVS